MKKIASVIKRMGTTYCCHPANYVKRLDTPLTDSVGTDIRKTFARVIAEREQAQATNNVRKIVIAK